MRFLRFHPPRIRDGRVARGFPRVCALSLSMLLAWAVGSESRSEDLNRPNVLRVARLTDVGSLDPAKTISMEDQVLAALMYQPVLEFRDGTNLVPVAATTWKLSPDRKTYTVEVRPGLRFSNGRAVTASDVAFSLERIANPKTASFVQSYTLGIFGSEDFAAERAQHLAGVRVPNESTLVIELSKPDLTFPFLLNNLLIVPREAVDPNDASLRRDPGGSGPYRLKEWRRGVHLIFDRNPTWSATPERRFDRIEVMIGGDESTHLMMFERGELDLIQSLGFADSQRLIHHPRWSSRVEITPQMAVTYISLNTAMPPLDNPKVRQAFNYAIDKPRRLFAASRQLVPSAGPIPAPMPGHDPGLSGYAHDPDRARALLAEARVPLPVQLTLWLDTRQISRLIAEGVQADLKAVGVEVELRVTAANQLWNLGVQPNRCAMILATYGAYPDPHDVLGSCLDGRTTGQPGGFNFAFYSNEEVNRLADAASGAPDFESRIRLCQQAERIVVADAPWIFLGHPNNFGLRQRWLRGVLFDPVNGYRLDHVWRDDGHPSDP